MWLNFPFIMYGRDVDTYIFFVGYAPLNIINISFFNKMSQFHASFMSDTLLHILSIIHIYIQGIQQLQFRNEFRHRSFSKLSLLVDTKVTGFLHHTGLFFHSAFLTRDYTWLNKHFTNNDHGRAKSIIRRMSCYESIIKYCDQKSTEFHKTRQPVAQSITTGSDDRPPSWKSISHLSYIILLTWK